MAGLELKITGADELAKKLRELPAKLEKRALQVSVLKALDDVLPEMRDAAPLHIDEQSPSSKRYGTLRSNMRVIKIKGDTRDQKAARLDTGKAFWGYIYEYGSRYQPARPWFAPKIRTLAQKVIDRFAEDVGEAIEKLWSEK